MFEFLPTVSIEIPSEENILSMQPAHKLLFKDKSRKVIRLVSFGGYLSIIILSLSMLLLCILLPLLYTLLSKYIGLLLIIVMILMIYYFNNNNRLSALLLFLSSGILGYIILNVCIGNNLCLLCLLRGLFSTNSLIYSINNESKIPIQSKETNIDINTNFKKSVLVCSLSGYVLGLVPGLGSAQGSVLAQLLTFNKKIKEEYFIVTNSRVNIPYTLFIDCYLFN